MSNCEQPGGEWLTDLMSQFVTSSSEDAVNKRLIYLNDLAISYGVPTKQLNQQGRLNPAKYPGGFAFQPNNTGV